MELSQDGSSRHHHTNEAPGLVVIGNFDGVHRGHQALIASASAQAEQRGLTPTLLTFSPHPAQVLGRIPPPTLTTLPRKLELIGRLAPSMKIVVMRFDREFAAQAPEVFVEQVLVRGRSARVVIVGQNFRFGKDRQGDFDRLVRLGQTHGFETRSHALVGDDAGPWSSTRAREAIAQGNLDTVHRILGRPHMLSGTVVKGDQRGRTLGFPTCNLGQVEEALPPFGVYAVLVDRVIDPADRPDNPQQNEASAPRAQTAVALSKGVANIGIRPTISGGEARPSVEVHLLDYHENLYGARLRVHLVARLRPEQRFAGLDALKAQITQDVEAARSRLASVKRDPQARGAWS